MKHIILTEVFLDECNNEFSCLQLWASLTAARFFYGGIYMKLAVEMAVMELDGEWNAVAVGEDSTKFHGMLRLNESGAEIIKLLAEETTVEKVHKTLCEKHPESDPDEIEKMLSDFLDQLFKEGLLKK